MKPISILIFFLIVNNVSQFIDAEQVNTVYFMQDVPVRHFLNPSFQPTSDYYISLPVIGFTQFSVGNNSLAFKDVIYSVKGKTITFLNTLGNIPLFYSKLKSNTVIHADFQTNLLSFGFRKESVYWTFSLSEKIEGTVNLPKDIFKILLFGTTSPVNNLFNYAALESDISAYTEAALGYSKQLDDKLTVGIKLKLLIGQANISNYNNQMSLEADIDKFALMGNGGVNFSSPGKFNSNNNYQSFNYIQPSTLAWLNPSGYGAGVDFGGEYRLSKKIRLSGAINDLGFIRWSRNTLNYQYGINYTLTNGINLFNSNSTFNTIQDSFNQLILNNTQLITTSKDINKTLVSKFKPDSSYTTFTTAKVNLGFEYILNDKLSLGLLSYSRIFRNILTEEITGSVNSHPFKWLNASVSYSALNGRMSNIGAGLGLKAGIFYWFLAADYIPLEVKNVPFYFGYQNPEYPIPIPYNSTTFNLSLGINLVFDKRLNVMKGLVRSKKRQDCNCDWK